MSRWFRFYDDAINDPKILKLPEAMRWQWAAVLCVASKNDGALPPIADLALMLRMTKQKAAVVITTLVSAGLLDKNETGFAPHNWSGRQYKSDVSNERVKRFRERKCNVTETVTVTPPETEQIQKTDQSRKKETREAALPVVQSELEIFWASWPNKVGKPAALKALGSAIKRGATLESILAGVESYIRDKPPDRPWLNPATFLNQNRWEDQPATVQGSPNGRRTVQQAADDLLEKLRAFDEPAPSNLCDRTGENAVRLLPSR
jgi:hypothetical protein